MKGRKDGKRGKEAGDQFPRNLHTNCIYLHLRIISPIVPFTIVSRLYFKNVSLKGHNSV